ncbi:hypothetical protein PSEMO_59350 [Pseudomonas putida]|uniref:Uncharacterized protein n=1 Tax=Pseudomonas putida TaxID=303 RepID=A0A1Q9QWA4_PSEPU|nr:hypothetical protein PSEMO_59350 [Pseudomonas putida]
MSDPLDRGAAHPPPTLGEGCLSRYDPEALDSEDGTDFPGAAELWQAQSAAQAGEALEQRPAEQAEEHRPAGDQVEVVRHDPPDQDRSRRG